MDASPLFHKISIISRSSLDSRSSFTSIPLDPINNTNVCFKQACCMCIVSVVDCLPARLSCCFVSAPQNGMRDNCEFLQKSFRDSYLRAASHACGHAQVRNLPKHLRRTIIQPNHEPLRPHPRHPRTRPRRHLAAHGPHLLPRSPGRLGSTA